MEEKNNQKHDCLFLWLNDKEFIAQESAKRKVTAKRVYKDTSLLLRILRRIHIKLGLPLLSIWYESWKKDLDNYKTVIVHASIVTVPVVKYLKRNNPKIRVIVWYWNPVRKCVDPKLYPDELCEKWSFDEEDCKEYGLKYNTQYYFDNVQLPNSKIENEVFFVGADKGRLEHLEKLQLIFEKLNIRSHFHITSSKKIKIIKDNKYKERICYSEVLNHISKSRAILDYVSENQSGLTLRSLESIFLCKKLITNDTSIKKKDFYNRNNIFIIGEDDISKLLEFLQIPYEPVSKAVIKRYDFNQWFSRFFS